jgi:hypothetical protein
VTIDSSGFVRLFNFNPSIGGNSGSFVYAVHGQTLGRFGASASGKYTTALLQQ